jgi:hypothetical protein
MGSRSGQEKEAAEGCADNLRSLCRYHDHATKEQPSGKRHNAGKFYVRDCNANGSPRDPNHPWFR